MPFTDSSELNEVLNGMVPPYEYAYLERKMLEEFDLDPQTYHFPTSFDEECYNYLYLDPKYLERIDKYSGEEWVNSEKALYIELSKFYAFVRSIFYIGKGTTDRAMYHLKETKRKIKRYLRNSFPFWYQIYFMYQYQDSESTDLYYLRNKICWEPLYMYVSSKMLASKMQQLLVVNMICCHHPAFHQRASDHGHLVG